MQYSIRELTIGLVYRSANINEQDNTTIQDAKMKVLGDLYIYLTTDTYNGTM